MIVLWGLTGDGPFDRVHEALRRRRAKFAVVDQRDALRMSTVLRFDGALHASLRVGRRHIALGEATAAYWRTYDSRRLPAVLESKKSAQSAALTAVWSVEETLLVWLEMSDGIIVNRPSAMASNGSKPYQLQMLRGAGFEVPRTLITTDAGAVLRFWTDCSSVIYKSISGARSIVSRLLESDIDRLEHIQWCPTQFQQYVPGIDHRVHVVGDDLFACEVISNADDYRYAGAAGEPARLRSVQLPADVAERCVRAARLLGLAVAGIDLRRAPDGRWFCFEVNPSPGFSYYEANTGQPVADAIATLLASSSSKIAFAPVVKTTLTKETNGQDVVVW